MSKELLRPMHESDLPLVLEWRNAESVRRNMYTYHKISPDEHYSWWEKQSDSAESKLLIFEHDGRPAGVVTFSKYTGKGGATSWAFYSGDLSKRGIGAKMEKAALRYAFEELAVARLECEVLSFNKRVVDFHVRHGFSIEGILRSAYQRGGESYDIYKLSMLAEEWDQFIRPDLQNLGIKRDGSLLGKVARRRVLLDKAKVNAFMEATGDRNPLHWDREYAADVGFEAPIVHGMLMGSLFSEIFGREMPGAGSVYLKQDLTFISPVTLGATVDVEVSVLSHVGRKVRVKTKLECNGVLSVDGYAELLVPR